MELDAYRSYCLSLPLVTEDLPFGPNVLTFRIMGKIFVLLPLDTERPQANLKCDPELAQSLRDTYPEQVLPGYHMNKLHWNTVKFDGLPPNLIQDWTKHSYDLIVSSLKKKEKEAMQVLLLDQAN